MFRPLHANTRAWLCRAGFLLGAVLPTLLVLVACLALRTAAYRQLVEARLSAQLGVAVRAAAVSHPAPGSTLLTELTFSDMESGKQLAAATQVEARQRGDGLLMRLPSLTLDRDVANWMRDWVARRLRTQTVGSEHDLRLLIERVTVEGAGERREHLADFDGQLQAMTEGSQAQATFRVPRFPQGGVVRLRGVRNRQGAVPFDGFELHTENSPLPCWLAGNWLDFAGWLGPKAEFRGSLWANETAHGWESQLTGEFARVDLEALVDRHFPHRLTGEANIRVPLARLVGGRIERASALVVAGPGQVSRSLVEAAGTHLQMVESPWGDDPRLFVEYRQLGFAATLDADGVRIEGRLAEPGAVLIAGREVLLTQPAGSRPLAALVQTLAPGTQLVVAGHEAAPLWSVLPEPASARAAATAERSEAPRTPRGRITPR